MKPREHFVHHHALQQAAIEEVHVPVVRQASRREPGIERHLDPARVAVLGRRAAWRGIELAVAPIGIGDPIPEDVDLLYVGGGQDREQALVAAGAGGYFLWLKNQEKAPQQQNPPANQIAVYDYRFTVPDGWEQTGGLPVDRQVLLQPIDRKTASAESPVDRIAVQEQTLTYDSGQDRVRALTELRQTYQGRKDKGDDVADFVDSTTFAGKSVVHYREVVETTDVDWYIQFVGRVQVSVGCQATSATKDRVRTACEQIVSSLDIKPK